MFGPFRYGAVASIAGPACCPCSISRFSLRSMKPFTFPPVRIVVTPPARYRRMKLAELPVDARTGRVIEVLVHHDQAGDHDLPARSIRRRPVGRRDARRVPHRRDVAAADDEGLVRPRRRTCAVDHPHVGQRDDRGVDLDEAAHGVAVLRLSGNQGGRGHGSRYGRAEASTHDD